MRTSISRFALIVSSVAVLSVAKSAGAQSTGTLTQTVTQRPTIGVLNATPTSGYTVDSLITYHYVLHTAGAPAPTTETIQFFDSGTAIGSPQIISSSAASNLLPYSQISSANGWTLTGTTATLSPASAIGPDGSSNTATQVAFPSTASSTSGVQLAVPGTSYASQSITLSVWAKSAAATTLTMTLADSPAVAVSSSDICALTTAWQRCTFTYAFPSNAGTGFSATFSVSGAAAQTITLWGAQVEQAASAGPYVSTIGVPRATGGQGGSVTFPYSQLGNGLHSITAVYGGDTNFLTSASNTLSVNIGKGTPSIALTASPASPSVYGQSIAFTATMSFSADTSDVPTGTVQFMDGAASLGTATISSGVATLTHSGATALAAGSHSITAIYSGDSEFNNVTSSTLTYTVTKAAGAVTITVSSSLNPSTYGDSVTFTITVASTVGAAIPTGSVTVTDGTAGLGTVTLNGTGAATLTVPLFTAGTHTLTITYSGDGNYN